MPTIWSTRPPGSAQERLRVGREDPGRGLLAHHLPHPAVEAVERLAIGQEGHGRARERPRHLRGHEGRDLPPGEAAVHGQRQGHRGVQVRPRDPARHVDAHGHRQAPGDVDREVAAVAACPRARPAPPPRCRTRSARRCPGTPPAPRARCPSSTSRPLCACRRAAAFCRNRSGGSKCPSSSPSTRAPPARAPSSSTTTGAIRRRRAAGVPADLPAAGLGRARPARDLGVADRGRGRGARAGVAPARATSPAIGITNQRETTVVWDRETGEPSTTPSSGRTAAPRTSATSSRPTAREA